MPISISKLFFMKARKISYQNVFHKRKLSYYRYQSQKKTGDHWSCIAHLSAEDMLKSAVIDEKKFNQRTSGPVNAYLTPGPGIYFNDFIHVYSHRAGADNPLGSKF